VKNEDIEKLGRHVRIERVMEVCEDNFQEFLEDVILYLKLIT
jgi:hypothetical protein